MHYIALPVLQGKITDWQTFHDLLMLEPGGAVPVKAFVKIDNASGQFYKYQLRVCYQ